MNLENIDARIAKLREEILALEPKMMEFDKEREKILAEWKARAIVVHEKNSELNQDLNVLLKLKSLSEPERAKLILALGGS